MGDLPRVRDSADQGMVPIFDLTNSFLNSLAPTTWADMIKEYDIETLSDFDEKGVLSDWSNWMWWGFVICVGLGVLLLLFTPVFGCCFCCCRCICGCCQEQKKVKKGKDAPSCCKTFTCGIILLVLTGSMLAASMVAYFAVGMVIAELEPNGAVSDIKTSVKTIDTFLHDTVDDIDQAVFPPFNQTTTEVLNILHALPEETVNELATATGIDPALYDLNDYTQQLPTLRGNLSSMDTLTTDLEALRIPLDQELIAVQVSINATLTGCPVGIDCSALQADVWRLISWARYDTLSNTTPAVAAIDTALANNVDGVVSQAVVSFESVQTEIENQVEDDIQNIENVIDDAEDELQYKFNNVSDTLLSTVDIENIEQTIDDGYSGYVEPYYEYVYYALLCFAILAFVTACLYVVGIPLGLFCGGGGGTHGANFIMAGISFTFIFSILFWLFVVVCLVTGGGLYLTGCRHITTYDESMQALEEVIRNTHGTRNLTNLAVKDVLVSCDNDQALYAALNVEENWFNVSEVLDLDNTNIEEELEKLANMTYDFIPDDIAVVDQISNFILDIDNQTSLIDFTGYFDELGKNETLIDLLAYATRLNDTAGAAEGSTFADELRAESYNLQTIHSTYVVPMGPLRSDLSNAATVSDTIVRSISLNQTMVDLTLAEKNLEDNGDQIISDSISKETDEIYDLLDKLTKDMCHSIEYDVARCKPLHTALTTAVQSPCVYMLDPLNALWFSFGWFMSFGLLAICFGSSVVGIFRSKAVVAKQSKVGAADRFPEYDAYPMVQYK